MTYTRIIISNSFLSLQGPLLHDLRVDLTDRNQCRVAESAAEPVRGQFVQEPHVALSGGECTRRRRRQKISANFLSPSHLVDAPHQWRQPRLGR